MPFLQPGPQNVLTQGNVTATPSMRTLLKQEMNLARPAAEPEYGLWLQRNLARGWLRRLVPSTAACPPGLLCSLL